MARPSARAVGADQIEDVTEEDQVDFPRLPPVRGVADQGGHERERLGVHVPGGAAVGEMEIADRSQHGAPT
jgi:hypothetical protein